MKNNALTLILWMIAIVISTLLPSAQSLYGQCLPGPGDACGVNRPFCSINALDGYSCTTNPDFGGSCKPNCPGGGVHSGSRWWSFYGGPGQSCITITPSNCTKNNGVVMGILEGCDCNSSPACNSSCMGVGVFTLCANLTPYKIYNLFITGCDRDVCDFTLSVSASDPPPLDGIDKIINVSRNDLNICKGEKNNFKIFPFPNSMNKSYRWTLDGQELPNFNLTEREFQFENLGAFELCVSAFANGYDLSSCFESTQKCVMINVLKGQDRIGPVTYICENLPYRWYEHDIVTSGEYKKEFKDYTTGCYFDSIRYFEIIPQTEPPCNEPPYAKGKIFWDLNKNRKYDVTDILLDKEMLIHDPGGNIIISSNGEYQVPLTKYSANTITPLIDPSQIVKISPPSYKIQVDNHYGYLPTSYDFAVEFIEQQDLEVFVTGTNARPGRQTQAIITVRNKSNLIPSNYDLTLNLPANWTAISSNPAYTSYSSNKILWTSLSGPSPKQERKFTVQINVPTTAVQDDPYSFIAEIQYPQDKIQTNNNATFNSTVATSFDPNNKIVNSKFIDPATIKNNSIQYTIRFQNTGKDTAFDIVVRDTLMTIFDVYSLQYLHSSHPCKIKMSQSGQIEFWFENILLPGASTNEKASTGFVQFSVKIDSTKTLDPDLTLRNRASIYFDYNLPVHTNTVSTGFRKITSIHSSKDKAIQLLPNPAKNQLYLRVGSNIQLHEYKIYSPYGILMLKGNSSNNSIDISNFPCGVYYIDLIIDQNIHVVKKFIKE
ncbi:MAG TPA: T9SS type A sorting domain-containing protein [Saprospiraceae bacterium]|nr:T9SS type A sorting domain-containing protein [Saprospiraceae bacterium]